MGQANRAPSHKRECRYHITIHALERFRERVDEEMQSRPDRDLSLLLDERLRHAIDTGNCTDIVDVASEGEDTKVVLIENRNGARSYVVMRPAPDAKPPTLSAVTVLTAEMGEVNFATGRWYVVHRPLAAALAGVRVTVLATPPPARIDTPVVPVLEVAPLGTRLSQAVAAERTAKARKVTAGAEWVAAQAAAVEATALVDELMAEMTKAREP